MPISISTIYPITGRKGTGNHPRLSIEELQKNDKQFTLFILSYLALQDKDPEAKPKGDVHIDISLPPFPNIPLAAQFAEIGGIHGLPFTVNTSNLSRMQLFDRIYTGMAWRQEAEEWFWSNWFEGHEPGTIAIWRRECLTHIYVNISSSLFQYCNHGSVIFPTW